MVSSPVGRGDVKKYLVRQWVSPKVLAFAKVLAMQRNPSSAKLFAWGCRTPDGLGDSSWKFYEVLISLGEGQLVFPLKLEELG